MTLTTVGGNASEDGVCPQPIEVRYEALFGVTLAVPQWEAFITTVVLTLIILLTIVGNILVILSVFTYKPLRIVQNFFIVSLAVADLTVALLVLPLNVAYSILGKWEFGIGFCKMWLTCDVLCCTSSILNLCAIALDRYWAITDPINYAQKRTVERVLLLIAGVWILSLVISSPPLIGWNDWPEDFSRDTPCQLVSNKGYVIYSSLGSFFIPLVIMTIVYLEIYLATKRRLRERARASKVNAMAVNSTTYANNKTGSGAQGGRGANAPLEQKEPQIDQESLSSETNNQQQQQHNNNNNSDNETKHNNKSNKITLIKSKHLEKRRKRENKKLEKLERLKQKDNLLEAPYIHEDSITDNNNNDEDGAEEEEGSGETQGHGGGENGQSQGNDSNNSSSNNIEETGSSSDKQKLKVCKKKSMRRGNASGGGTTVSQFIEEKQKISLSKERRAARTLGIIMGVFVVCWLPFFLMYVILPFCRTCCPSDKFINFITWLGYINSALNPIIYTIFNLDYRRAFKKLLGMKP